MASLTTRPRQADGPRLSQRLVPRPLPPSTCSACAQPATSYARTSPRRNLTPAVPPRRGTAERSTSRADPRLPRSPRGSAATSCSAGVAGRRRPHSSRRPTVAFPPRRPCRRRPAGAGVRACGPLARAAFQARIAATQRRPRPAHPRPGLAPRAALVGLCIVVAAFWSTLWSASLKLLKPFDALRGRRRVARGTTDPIPVIRPRRTRRRTAPQHGTDAHRLVAALAERERAEQRFRRLFDSAPTP